jgi:hypothetical protein
MKKQVAGGHVARMTARKNVFMGIPDVKNCLEDQGVYRKTILKHTLKSSLE